MIQKILLGGLCVLAIGCAEATAPPKPAPDTNAADTAKPAESAPAGDAGKTDAKPADPAAPAGEAPK